MKEVLQARIMDPGRGAFCATTKYGVPLAMPPTRREPLVDRERNPRGSRHVLKTQQDYMKREDRPRVHEAQRRLEMMRKGG